MSAAIRSVVRLAGSSGIEVLGVERGFEGLIYGNFTSLGSRAVANIIQRGGTILETSRSQHFRTEAGRDPYDRDLSDLVGDNRRSRRGRDVGESVNRPVVAIGRLEAGNRDRSRRPLLSTTTLPPPLDGSRFARKGGADSGCRCINLVNWIGSLRPTAVDVRESGGRPGPASNNPEEYR